MQYYLQKLIPSNYQKYSGLTEYKFLITNPSHSDCNYIRTSRGSVKKISVSSYCETIFYNKKYFLLIPKAKDANLYQAVLLTGKTLITGDRIHRFLKLYQSYECLSSNPDPILKAIRNGLSHPPAILNNKNTRQNLLEVFGDSVIDLNKGKHKRLFFTHLGRLFIENDKLIFNRIKSSLTNLYHLKSRQDVIYPWQIKRIK